MSSTIVTAGVSHHTAPIGIRERLVYRSPDTAAAIAELMALPDVSEGVLLSTCNRTEFYLAITGETDRALDAVGALLSDRLGENVRPFTYERRHRDAVRHLFRVAAGLDSMVLGESQIQGQVRDAWEQSRNSSGIVLNRLFQSALQAASRVRSETGIVRGAASVSSAAVQLAKQIFGALVGRRVMILGSGDTAATALACLTNEGVRAAVVANRTLDRAEQLAHRHGARALALDGAWGELPAVDLLLCSTAASEPIVTASRVLPALARRGDRPLCIIDIALPRNVEPAVGSLDNVFLYDLDDLNAVITSNVDRRRDELPTADQVVDAEVQRYWEWLTGLATVPVLTEFRAHVDTLRERELQEALRKLAHLAPADREAVEAFSRSLMNKFLHSPTVRLRAAASNGRGLGIVDAVRYLFGLERRDQSDEGAANDHPASQESR